MCQESINTLHQQSALMCQESISCTSKYINVSKEYKYYAPASILMCQESINILHQQVS